MVNLGGKNEFTLFTSEMKIGGYFSQTFSKVITSFFDEITNDSNLTLFFSFFYVLTEMWRKLENLLLPRELQLLVQ